MRCFEISSSEQRLAEFYRRLGKLPQAASADEALTALCATLDQVEDDLSGIPKQIPPPSLSDADGRMYCPREDYIDRREDGSIIAMTRGHLIVIQADGSICIVNRLNGVVEFKT